MEIFITTLKSVALLTLMAIPGYFIAKKKLIDIDKSVNFISVMLLYICTPFVTIDAFLNSTYHKSLLINMTVVFIFTIIFFTVLLIVNTKFMSQLKAELVTQRQCAYGATLGNIGYMGIPLLQLISPGNSILILYQSIALISFNIVSWTIGAYQLSGQKSYASVKKALLNPATISLILVLPFFFTNTNFIKYSVPGIQNTVSFFAKMVGPLVMSLIGIKASELTFKELLLDSKTHLTAFLKLIISPMLAFLVLEVLSTFMDVRAIRLNIIILAAMPVANNLTVFSSMLNLDTKYAAKTVILSMIYCIATIPAMLYLFL